MKFIFFCSFFFLYSCHNGEDSPRLSESVSSSEPDHQYEKFLEANILSNTNNPLKGSLFFAENKSITSSEKRLVFVSTGNDCSTCINQEMSLMKKVFQSEMDKILLVSDSLGMLNLERNWDKLVAKSLKIKLPYSKLKEYLGYLDRPLYLLFNKRGEIEFRYLVSPDFPGFTMKVLAQLKNSLKSVSNE